MVYQQFEVPGQVRIKKNSRRIMQRFKKGGGTRPSIEASKLYKIYEMRCLIWLAKHVTPVKLEYPIYCHYHFYVETHRKFDLGNACEGIADILQTRKLIVDDDYKHFIPVFHSEYSGVTISKDNPATVVTLTDENYNLKGKTPEMSKK